MSEKSTSKKGLNKYVTIGIVAVVVIVMATSVLFYGSTLATADGIAKGVYIGNIDMSGRSEEADFADIYSMENISADTTIQVECEEKAFEISAGQIGLETDVESAISSARSYAKEGGFFKRVYEALSARIFKKVFVPEHKCDEQALMAAIEENLEEKIVPVTPYSVEIGKDEIIVTNSTGGTGFDKGDIAKRIIEDIADGKIDNTIILNLIELNAEPIDFEKFEKEYKRAPKDATYTENDGSYVFTEEVVGIDFDSQNAKAIIEANAASTEPYSIPAVITLPDVTVVDLQAKFATDRLASYSTSFSSSDSNRAANVILAARKINGVVLNPGERFSYNKIVGPRTVAAGFKIAHVYEGDRVVDGVGGGICQVSSTLYNTVLLADLKIVSRTNHSMPVAYVPMGRDATVSYGAIDFVFENNKKYPVKIVAKSANRNLTIEIYGVKQDDTVIEIVTENAGYIPYSTKEVVDETLNSGEKKIVKNGSNGTIVNTYKVYKKNGVIIDKQHTSKSTYIPIARQINVGPANKEDKPAQVPDEKEPILPTPTPDEPNTDVPSTDEPSGDAPYDTTSPEEENSDKATGTDNSNDSQADKENQENASKESDKSSDQSEEITAPDGQAQSHEDKTNTESDIGKSEMSDKEDVQ